MSRKRSTDPYAGKKTKWTTALERRLMALRKAGTPWEAIAQIMEISQASLQCKYSTLVRSQSLIRLPAPKSSAPYRDTNVVEQARQVLRGRGCPPRQLDLMHLDALMRAANEALHAAGLPQLGRKPEWLVDTPAESR